MVSVTNEIKWRSLISHGALVRQDGGWSPLSMLRTSQKRTATNLLNAAREKGIVVKCACGCGAMCSYGEIEFDQAIARVNGGATEIRWIQPLRRNPCHYSTSPVGLTIKETIRRILEKFFGEARPMPKPRWAYRPLARRPMHGYYVIDGGRA